MCVNLEINYQFKNNQDAEKLFRNHQDTKLFYTDSKNIDVTVAVTVIVAVVVTVAVTIDISS